MLNNRIDLTTLDSGIITISEEEVSPFGDTIGRYCKHILDTKEQGIISSLKQLGWLPPDEVGKVRELLQRYIEEGHLRYEREYDSLEEFIEEYL